MMELAPRWEIETVLDSLRSKERLRLAQFIKDRYETRFFEPICLLENEAIKGIPWRLGDPDPTEPIRPYGFAIMSLACQMIETLESYRLGLPTTNKEDFKRIRRDCNYSQRPPQVKCAEADILGTGKAFKSFFETHTKEFPSIDGAEFYANVRNALLHQSQTRNGLVINIHHPDEVSPKADEVLVEKILYRDSFVRTLRACFETFLKDLRENPADDGKWKMPERKIWWIAWLSDSESVLKWTTEAPAVVSPNTANGL
jgi:hypothetical protein